MSHYGIGKYSYPGTGWYVLLNGHICSSGTLKECKEFVKRNQTEPKPAVEARKNKPVAKT